MNLNHIPKPLLIVGVFIIGVTIFVLLQKPHTRCDSQLEALRQSESGFLFIRNNNKGIVRPALYTKAMQNCQEGLASPGACLQYFSLMRRMLVDLQNIDSSCGEDLMSISEFKNALSESLVLMVRMAWGEVPPESTAMATAKMEMPDLALFCKLKDAYIRYAGAQAWEDLKPAMIAKLPGEERQFETDTNGKVTCSNCEGLASAEKTLGSARDVYARSLINLRCEQLN